MGSGSERHGAAGSAQLGDADGGTHRVIPGNLTRVAAVLAQQRFKVGSEDQCGVLGKLESGLYKSRLTSSCDNTNFQNKR